MINLPYDVRLRAGFNMLAECGDEIVFPQKSNASRDCNMELFYKDEYNRLKKRYYIQKSSQ